jgi:hypothetical protein
MGNTNSRDSKNRGLIVDLLQDDEEYVYNESYISTRRRRIRSNKKENDTEASENDEYEENEDDDNEEETCNEEEYDDVDNKNEEQRGRSRTSTNRNSRRRVNSSRSSNNKKGVNTIIKADNYVILDGSIPYSIVNLSYGVFQITTLDTRLKDNDKNNRRHYETEQFRGSDGNQIMLIKELVTIENSEFFKFCIMLDTQRMALKNVWQQCGYNIITVSSGQNQNQQQKQQQQQHNNNILNDSIEEAVKKNQENITTTSFDSLPTPQSQSPISTNTSNSAVAVNLPSANTPHILSQESPLGAIEELPTSDKNDNSVGVMETLISYGNRSSFKNIISSLYGGEHREDENEDIYYEVGSEDEDPEDREGNRNKIDENGNYKEAQFVYDDEEDDEDVFYQEISDTDEYVDDEYEVKASDVEDLYNNGGSLTDRGSRHDGAVLVKEGYTKNLTRRGKKKDTSTTSSSSPSTMVMQTTDEQRILMEYQQYQRQQQQQQQNQEEGLIGIIDNNILNTKLYVIDDVNAYNIYQMFTSLKSIDSSLVSDIKEKLEDSRTTKDSLKRFMESHRDNITTMIEYNTHFEKLLVAIKELEDFMKSTTATITTTTSATNTPTRSFFENQARLLCDRLFELQKSTNEYRLKVIENNTNNKMSILDTVNK